MPAAPLYELPKGKPSWLLVRSDKKPGGAAMDSIFAELKNKYGDKINFISLNWDKPSTEDAILEYSLTKAPASVIADSKGIVMMKFQGKKDAAELEEKLNALIGR